MHKIFLIHGMGNHAAGWSKAIQAQIRKHYDPAKYAFLKNNDFDSKFEFKEIVYNNHFDKYLEEAAKKAEELSKWNKLVPNIDAGIFGFLQKVIDLAAKKPSNNFLVSHLADVALYMATDVGELVKSDIHRQMAAAMQPPFDPAHDRWSVIAHSLGTRITTEMLQAAATTGPSFTNFGSAQALVMIANSSRLLQRLSPYKSGDVYRNAVFPSNIGGACDQYVNIGHALDPVSFVHRFDPPPDFGDGQVFANNLYHSVQLGAMDVHAKDIHAVEHYLEHPQVHGTIFRYLVSASGRKGPTEAELNKAISDYRVAALQAALSSVWRESLAQLGNDAFGNVGEIVRLWEKYGELLA